ncbi:MAG: hypothetical protein HGA45_32865 [Chloroflexales bacterium]|nr:hypothetical protein [Chloroflexales bacterium]
MLRASDGFRAFLSRVLGPVVRWLEVRALPAVTRRVRVHHGLPPDAPRWALRLAGLQPHGAP